MLTSDWIAAFGSLFTGIAAIAAALTWLQYRRDQHRQRAAQTREALQAIIGDCSQFLRPLSEQYPYPILHTATAITKEFCSRMRRDPRGENVQALLCDKELLLSICVEGWINSTQIIRMLGIVEELERKATSYNLRGKLLIMCDASFLLAGLVAQVCSPKSFYDLLIDLKFQSNPEAKVEDVLNTLTVRLQKHICNEFNDHYKDIIRLTLLFIQTVADAFINLEDRDLLDLAKAKENHLPLSTPTYPSDSNEQIVLLHTYFQRVKMMLSMLSPDLNPSELMLGDRNYMSKRKKDYAVLCDLMKSMEEEWEKILKTSRAKQSVIA